MNKWTLKKINECKEIKFRTKVVITGGSVFQHNRILVGKSTDRLTTVIKNGDMVAVWSVDEIERRDFKFYRPDGTEILPPEEDNIEVLYECIDNYGECKYYFNSGRHPFFSRKEQSGTTHLDCLKRKTGRTLAINMTTFEIVEDER